MVLEELPGVLDGFYALVADVPETAAFFRSRDHMNHAKAMQVKHWGVILEGRFDAAYEASVTRIGEIHNKLGLEPRWYIGGYNALVTGVLGAIEKRMPTSLMDRARTAERRALQAAVTKAAMLDMDLAIAVYIEAGRRDRRETLDRLANDFEARSAASSASWPRSPARCRPRPAASPSRPAKRPASPASSPRLPRTPPAMCRQWRPRPRNSAPPLPRSASR